MNILFVCTGNICRSPLAAQMFTQMLQQSPVASTISVTNAGIYSMEGQPMDAASVAAMQKLGFVPGSHTATQLQPHLVEQADLILTSTEDQRAPVVEHHIPANRYTFTLKEFANLAEFLTLEHIDGEDFRPVLPANPHDRLAATLKWRGTAPLIETLDIKDPYGMPQESFDSMALETREALAKVVAWLS